MNWTEKLLLWYREHKRDFPWRKAKVPYRVWLSEVILQQTRVEQGLPYYEKFVQTYPTVKALAAAPEEEVLKLWQGLGYYSRARNMLATARWIVDNNQGKFPTTFNQLLPLKGIGDYTASAIASICFDEPQAVVDGNVYRFLARCFGIDLPIDRSSTHKEFKRIAQTLMAGASPGEFNQAMMEFGAVQCVPKSPKCLSCPFQKKCIAFQQGEVMRFPIKEKKNKVRQRYFNYLVPEFSNHTTLLHKRTTKGIWQNLYEFPLIETEELINQKKLHALPAFKPWQRKANGAPILLNPQPIKHLLSHQQLFIQFWKIQLHTLDPKAIAYKELRKYPVPVVLAQFIEKHYPD